MKLQNGAKNYIKKRSGIEKGRVGFPACFLLLPARLLNFDKVLVYHYDPANLSIFNLKLGKEFSL